MNLTLHCPRCRAKLTKSSISDGLLCPSHGSISRQQAIQLNSEGGNYRAPEPSNSYPRFRSLAPSELPMPFNYSSAGDMVNVFATPDVSTPSYDPPEVAYDPPSSTGYDSSSSSSDSGSTAGGDW